MVERGKTTEAEGSWGWNGVSGGARRKLERGNRVAGNLKDFRHSVNFLLKVG